MSARNLRPCMPGYNKPRHDVPRIEIGMIVAGYLVAGSRWIRDGTFGSGHDEFYIMKIKPEPGRRSEGWVAEYIIQDYIWENRDLFTWRG